MQEVRARNSASIVDIATVFCLLLDQAIRDPPRNMRYPVIDFLSVVLLPQSASQYAVNIKSLPLRVSFKCSVPLRYLNIFFTEVQLRFVGDAICEHALDVTREMSGLVATMA